jgi:hypothetical protein
MNLTSFLKKWSKIDCKHTICISSLVSPSIMVRSNHLSISPQTLITSITIVVVANLSCKHLQKDAIFQVWTKWKVMFSCERTSTTIKLLTWIQILRSPCSHFTWGVTVKFSIYIWFPQIIYHHVMSPMAHLGWYFSWNPTLVYDMQICKKHLNCQNFHNAWT